MWSGDWNLLARLMRRYTPISAQEISDNQHLTAVRHDVTRYGYKRPLVEWTLSPEWTDATPFTDEWRWSQRIPGGGVKGNRGMLTGEIDEAF